MNLAFSSDEPLVAVITDSTNGEPLYQTETQHWINRTTETSKFIPGTGFQPLARVNWETWKTAPATVIYKGQRILVADFLKKDGGTPTFPERKFTASDGRQYKWKVDSRLNFKLYDDDEGIITMSHRKMYGIRHEKRDLNIDVLPPGLPILDDIVVTFIVECHIERRRAAQA